MISGYDQADLRGQTINYRLVRKLKSELLWCAYKRFRATHFGQRTRRELTFLRFCADEHQWLYDYCIFRMFMDMEESRENWELWSEDYNTIEKTSLGTVQLTGKDNVDGVLKRIEDLSEIGFSHVIFNMPDVYEITPLETFKNEIIPAVSDL